jgi:integrase
METLIPLSKAAKTSDFVFRPYKNMNTLYHHFKRLLKKLGLSGTLHDLRHTFASHLSMAGVPIPVIKELMGHSDIATTMIYAHLSPSTYKEAISKLDFQVRPK